MLSIFLLNTFNITFFYHSFSECKCAFMFLKGLQVWSILLFAWENTPFSKTTLLQREPCFTMFYKISSFYDTNIPLLLPYASSIKAVDTIGNYSNGERLIVYKYWLLRVLWLELWLPRWSPERSIFPRRS